MTDASSDNDPVSVNAPYTVEIQDPHQSLLNEGGNGDFFVCRKCNKVFNNLSQYVEHKVKEENFSLGQTRAKSDQRIMLPHLFEKRKRKAKQDPKSKKTKTGHESAVASKAEDDDGSQNIAQIVQVGPFSDTETPFKVLGSNLYSCTLCTKTFKRDAALRWHLKRDHKGKNSGDDSITSEDEVEDDIKADQDEDFTVEVKEQQTSLTATEISETKTQEIVIVIENPPAAEKLCKTSKPKGVTDDSAGSGMKAPRKNFEQKRSREEPTKPERPFSCEMCGRSFKELTVLKAHALVHSEERHFVCTVDDCPYAFKTKGGLVRHMRRHTGDRPFSCDKCGRAFTESGSLTRHLKGRRNCATLSDKAYPRYKKSWTYHPNIPAVADPAQRDPQRGRSMLGTIPLSTTGMEDGEEISYIITELLDDDTTALSTQKMIMDGSQENTSVSSVSPAAITVTISPLENSMPTANDVPVSKENDIKKPCDYVAAVTFENAEHQDDIDDSKKTETLTRNEVVLVTEETPVISNPQSQQTTKLETSSLLLSNIVEASRNSESSLAQEGFSPVPTCRAEASLPSNVSIVTCLSQPQASTHVSSPPASSKHDQEGRIKPAMGLEDDDFLDLQISSQSEKLQLTQCLVCKKDFEAIEGLEIHLRTHLADEPSRCGLCHFTAQDREELRNHILSMHYQSLNDIEASVLAMEVEEASLRKGETIQSRQLMLRNALTAVKQLYSLKKMKNSSEQEKPGLSTTGSVQCMVCNKFFRGGSYLRQHMRTHTGDRPHQCLQCGRSFTSRDILKKHMYVHVERKDYKCGECGKLFKRLGHVQQHLRSHSQERTFRCTECDKLFKTQHSLKVHMRTHSGVNPYKCHICNDHFRERGSLQRHMRLHTGEKPFKCHLCNRAFSEQGTLSRHLKSKVPCSANRDEATATPRTSILAQFSSVVAGSEQIFIPLDQDAQKIIVPGEQTSQQIILPGDSAEVAAQHGLGQHHFFVTAGQEDQELQVGSEYVVVQSGEEVSEVHESGDSTTVDGVIDFNAAFGQEQIPGSETLQVMDPSTGETVIIVAEKAIVDLVREKYSTLMSTEDGFILAKIEQILAEAREGLTNSSPITQEQQGSADNAVSIKQESHEEIVYREQSAAQLNQHGTESGTKAGYQVKNEVIVG